MFGQQTEPASRNSGRLMTPPPRCRLDFLRAGGMWAPLRLALEERTSPPRWPLGCRPRFSPGGTLRGAAIRALWWSRIAVVGASSHKASVSVYREPDGQLFLEDSPRGSAIIDHSPMDLALGPPPGFGSSQTVLALRYRQGQASSQRAAAQTAATE